MAKGKILKSPKVPGIKLSQEIVRQAIFAILAEKVDGAICLDLYAGSGAIGIEALSRGAAECDFIDNNEECVSTIKENLRNCHFDLNHEVLREDSLKYVSNAAKNYDIIFMDPYYDQASHKHIFKMLPRIMNANSTIVFLHGSKLNAVDFLDGKELKIVDERKYGATVTTFITQLT